MENFKIFRDFVYDSLTVTDSNRFPNVNLISDVINPQTGEIVFETSSLTFYGYTGIIWIPLAAGFLGSQGAQGPQGPQGLDSGVQGSQGAQGSQGPQGVQGVQGPQGPGAQGAQGVQGSQGPQGAQGQDSGVQGSPGSQGVQGVQGVQGPQGSQGASQGPQGPQGSSNAQGPQGPQGPQGGQGAQGSQGNQGAQGSQGAQGTQGSQGAQGPQGLAPTFFYTADPGSSSPGPYCRVWASGAGITYAIITPTQVTITIPNGVNMYFAQIDCYNGTNMSANQFTLNIVDNNPGRNSSQIPIGAASENVVVPRVAFMQLVGSPGTFVGPEQFPAVGGRVLQFVSAVAGTTTWIINTGVSGNSRLNISYL